MQLCTKNVVRHVKGRVKRFWGESFKFVDSSTPTLEEVTVAAELQVGIVS